MISLTLVFFTSFLFSGLIEGSTKFNSDIINYKDITPVSNSCRTILCLKRICLFFSLNILLLTLAIATWLSQHIDTCGVGLVHKGIFAKRFISHSTSELAFSKAINREKNSVFSSLPRFHQRSDPLRLWADQPEIWRRGS